MDFLKILWMLLIASIPGCLESYSWHQKVTIEVETPEGVKTGSSVVAVRWKENGELGRLNGPAFHSNVEGEAPFVEVKPGAYLFAILRGAAFLAPCTFVGGAPISSHDGLLVNYGLIAQTGPELERSRETRTVPEECMPMLVTFKDINDAATVERVNPDDLSATFGPGFQMKSIILGITDKPKTRGKVETVLRWWCDYRKRRARLNGSTEIGISDNELSNNLGTGQFKIGDCE
ncbi:hypothetical protein [Chelativorans sp. M5D2P16]|uniref:hypothetical protein n=1 Tax=Chelativorans sp. M5D2P16 TaxID=3095678 RepID=UPI002ACA99F2|nr:hypothetical protein [Chelativorans sp. M5D2P16]MDZ5696881.1 hypothetical protein [Chelativorans sp. M5D2P16]